MRVTLGILLTLCLAAACSESVSTATDAADGGGGADAAGTPPDASGGASDAGADAGAPDSGSNPDLAHLGNCNPVGTPSCTTDGWCAVTLLFPGSIFELYAVSETDIWLAAKGGAFHFDGTQVCRLDKWWGSSLPRGVHGSGPNDVWLVSSGGVIAHWDGTAARAVMGPVAGADGFSAVWAASDKDAWAVGSKSLAHWNGATWTTQAAPPATAGSLSSVRGLDATHAWAAAENVGAGGDVLAYDGSAWSVVHHEAGASFKDVLPFSVSDVWAVGGGASSAAGTPGVVRHWTTAWSSVPAGSWTWYLNAIEGRATNDLRVFGHNGAVERWNGSGWTAEQSGVSNSTDPSLGRHVYSAQIVGTKVFAVGKDGLFMWKPL